MPEAPAAPDKTPEARVAPDKTQASKHGRRWTRDLLIGLLLVVTLELVVSALKHEPLWERWSWIAQDMVMRLWTGHPVAVDDPPRFAFIDIDNDAFKAWGTSGVTNRERLRDLIGFATGGGARLVIVDVDLTRPDPGDAALRDFLGAYPATGPNLIFARPLGPSPPRSDAAWTKLPLVIEPAVGGNPRIHFATVAFFTDADFTVRRWRLYEAMCDDGRPVPVPSIELLTVAVMDQDEDGAQDLLGILSSRVKGSCDAVVLGWNNDLRFTRYPEVRLGVSGRDEVVPFIQPWPIDPYAEATLAWLPALKIVKPGMSPDLVRDRIVIIGGSNAGSRDTVLTPIGVMPGAMVLENAIDALLRQGQLHEPPEYVAFPIGVVVGMAVWALLYVFHFALAVILITVPLGLTVVVLSHFLLGHGIWLDVAVPTAGVIMHRWIVMAEMIWHDVRTYKWRGLLGPHLRGHGPSILVLGLLASAAHAAVAGDPPLAGHIDDITGDPASIRIERPGQQPTVQIGSNLFAGDRVSVMGATTLVIEPGHIVVTALTPPSPLKAAADAKPVGSWFDRIAYVLTGYVREEVRAGSVEQMISKGISGPLALPLLTEPEHQRVVAGSRILSVGWTGGEPPFTAVLRGATGSMTLVSGTKERRVSRPVWLDAGRYDLAVTDKTGVSRTAPIEAVQTSFRVDSNAPADAPPDIRLIVDAIALAKEEGGVWRLEAYQRLIDAGTHIDRLLADRLAAGVSLD
jgi:CHASE2 domain-containing sensor protein